MKINRPIFLILTSLIFASCSAGTTKTVSPDTNTSVSQSAPNAEQIKKNIEEATTPGKQHQLLMQLAGNWNAEAKFWIDPAGKPEVNKGRASNKLIYGGRYLEMTYKGKAMGKPFEGEGVMGFDNLKRKYFSTWIDSMSTALLLSEGTIGTEGKVITLDSEFTCPMTRQPMQGQDVVTIVDKNNYKFEMYEIRDGEKIKHLEINYKRAK